MKDIDKYKIRLNVKAMCLFEALTGKNYGDITDEDSAALIYCCFVANNDVVLTFEEFLILLEDKKVQKWVEKSFKDITAYSFQFKTGAELTVSTKDEEKEENHTPSMRDICGTLISTIGLDPHYVMYEMEIWEIEMYYKSYEDKRKEELEEARLWTYLKILFTPMIDTKKLTSPDKVFPFPWETENDKKKAEQKLEEISSSVMAFFESKKQIQENKEEEDA